MRPGRPTGAIAAALGTLVLGAGCASEDRAQEPVPGVAPSVAFIGDSWTVGSGAAESGGYAPLTAQRLGWRYTTLGVSGSGYVQSGAGGPFGERIDDAVATRPDAIVVQGSLNDQQFRADDVAAAARDTLARLRDAVGPGTRVLVVGAPDCPGCDARAIDALNEAISGAADAAGVPFVDPAEPAWVDPEAAELWADPLHPDDDGHRVMAQRLAPLLRDLVEG